MLGQALALRLLPNGLWWSAAGARRTGQRHLRLLHGHVHHRQAQDWPRLSPKRAEGTIGGWIFAAAIGSTFAPASPPSW
ncbi:MAG: hypothetical protein R2856_20895 [Caldilineaceae bacterium]